MAKEPRPKGYPKLKNYKPSQFMLPTSHYDKKKADRAVTFIENLCHTKGKWAGTPFWLLPWQEQLIRDIFGIVKPDGNRQFRTTFVEICKKVGKSELAAAIALYLLYADNEPSAEVYGAAADRQQASIVFDVAKQMVEMSPALMKRSKLMAATKRIVNYGNAGYYQVLSAEVGGKHGFSVSGLVFDEIHTQPNRQLYDVLTKGSSDAEVIWMEELVAIITEMNIPFAYDHFAEGESPEPPFICWNGIKTTVKTVVNAIKTAVSGAFIAMWNGIKNTVSGIYNTIKDGFNKAVGFITGLASSAFKWGSDIINGIVDGIKSCIGKVKDAVGNVAETIKSFLHFSVPDEGPLTDYESWMPDFMSGLAKGIEKSKGMVKDAVNGLASDMIINPKIGSSQMAMAGGGAVSSADLSSLVSAIREGVSGVNGGGGDIVIPVYLGGTMLDEVIVNAQQRANLRSGGR